jgi:hypothetical protein
MAVQLSPVMVVAAAAAAAVTVVLPVIAPVSHWQCYCWFDSGFPSSANWTAIIDPLVAVSNLHVLMPCRPINLLIYMLCAILSSRKGQRLETRA